MAVYIAGQTKTAFKPFLTTGARVAGGELSIGSGAAYRKGTVIIATARFAWRGKPASSETLLLVWRGGKLEELAPTVALGTQGRDAEWSREVKATPRGLLLSERRPGVRRCDGKAPYLYPRAYDWKRGRFRPITNLVRVASGSPTLTATTAPPPSATNVMRPASFRVTSASTSRDARNAGELAAPLALGDGTLATAWSEGFSGFGRGEFITATGSLRGARVRAIRIVPGDASSDKAFRATNRLKRIALLVGSSKSLWIEFPVDPATRPRDTYYWAVLPEDVDTRCVTVVIDQVYGKSRGGVTAIAELAVFTDLELTAGGIEATLAARVTAGGSRAPEAARTLATRGALATAALIAELTSAPRNLLALRRLRLAIAQVGHPSGLREIARAFAIPGLTDDERRMTSDALVAIGAPAVVHLAQLLVARRAPRTVRLAAAAALGRITDSSAHAALLAAAGTGSRHVRLGIVTALATRAPSELPAIVAAAAQAERDTNEPREADLWRAAARMARRTTRPLLVAQAGRAIAARLSTATSYELRYRLFDAAGSVESDDTIRALARVLRATTETAQDHALRRVAAFALSRNQSQSARALLVHLAGNTDPGTRAEALRGLGARADLAPDTDAAMGERLATDPWYNVRRIAASALARRCNTAAAAAPLFTAVAADKDVGVVRAALTSLVSCRAPGIEQTLFTVARNKKRPPAAREQATTLVATLGACTSAKPLARLFRQFRSEAWSSAISVRLASAAAGAMGALGCKQAALSDALLRAARDSSFPSIQAAAVTALGRLCPHGARAIIAALRISPNRGVAIAARGAWPRCR